MYSIRQHLSHQTEQNLLLGDAVRCSLNLTHYRKLAGWLFKVTFNFNLKLSTYANCLKLLTVYYSHNTVNLNTLRLHSAVCLDISASLIEIYAPEVDDYMYMSDGVFTKEQFIEARIQVVKFFNGRTRQLTCYDVFDQLIYDGNEYENEQHISLIAYVYHHRFLSVDPVMLVDACIESYDRMVRMSFDNMTEIVSNVLKVLPGMSEFVTRCKIDGKPREFLLKYDHLAGEIPYDLPALSLPYYAAKTRQHRKSVGEYDELYDLGEGTFGTVVLATRDSDVFAVKRTIIQDDDIEPILRELNVLSTYKHENIVECYAFRLTSELAEIELESGMPLDKLLGTDIFDSASWDDVYINKTLTKDTLPDKRVLMEDIIRGVKYLHSVGVLHRDLKTANVIVVKGPLRRTAKIIDLGMCEFMVNTINDSSSKLTEVATLPYRPPELLSLSYYGRKYNGDWDYTPLNTKPPDYDPISKYSYSVDIWSVGVMMLEIETGHFPFPSDMMFMGESTLRRIFQLLGIPSLDNPYMVNAYSWVPYDFPGTGLDAIADPDLRKMILKMLDFDPDLREM